MDLVFFLLFIVVLILWFRMRSKNKKLLAETQELQQKYSVIMDVDNELASRKVVLNNLEQEIAQLTENKEELLKQAERDAEKALESKIQAVDDLILKKEEEIGDLEEKIQAIKDEYKDKRDTYSVLKNKLAIYEESLELAEVGIYTPHFDFGTSEDYKNKIKEIREKQKKMVKHGLAARAEQSWTVNGSAKEGEKMTKQAISLALRSFNNECDVIISNTTWKNIQRMEERLDKSFDDINKFNKSNTISISRQYKSLKLDELHLVYEHKMKVEEERLHQAELRRLEREEEQLRKEAERAKKEEEKLQDLLNKVQEKANHSSGEELARLQKEIEEMGAELRELQRQNDRVKAMAEQTKLGYVYVISNIGSFGKDVYKIGMTRRLDPMDRVRELGDASVPFYFDVHAMIFSEDAPALEAKIQRIFADKRVNLVNYRKEFFNVTLDEIKEVVLAENDKVEFVDDVEAKEYTETQQLKNQTVGNADELPDFI